VRERPRVPGAPLGRLLRPLWNDAMYLRRRSRDKGHAYFAGPFPVRSLDTGGPNGSLPFCARSASGDLARKVLGG